MGDSAITAFVSNTNPKSINEIVTWLQNHHIGAWNKTFTTTPVIMNSMPNFMNYLTMFQGLGHVTANEKTYQFAKWQEAILSFMNPVPLKIYILQGPVAKRSLSFFSNPTQETIDNLEKLENLIKKYNAPDMGLQTTADLEPYLQLCKAFRKHMGDIYNIDELKTVHGSVLGTLNIKTDYMTSMRAMLTMMINKAGINVVERVEGGVPPHYAAYEELFLNPSTNEELFFSIPLSKRRKAKGISYEDPPIKEEDTPAGEVYTPIIALDQGVHLVSTAMLHFKRVNLAGFQTLSTVISGNNYKEIKYGAWLKVAFLEGEKLEEQSTQTGFSAQKSNIDVPFNFFYYAYRSNVTNNVELHNFASMLGALGSKISGKRMILAKLMTLGSSGRALHSKVTENVNKNCPPFMLTAQRLWDLVAIGGIDIKKPEKCLSIPTFSWRYYNNLSTSSPMSIPLITAMWEIEGLISQSETDIRQSEHIMHQFLTSKTCIGQNVHNVTGNFAKLKINPVD